MAMVTEYIDKTEALVRTWEVEDTSSPPPVPPRHPARMAPVEEFIHMRRLPLLPQRNPRRLSIDIGKAYGIPSSPYAASSVYSSAPPSPVAESGESAYASDASYSSNASSRSYSHSRRSSLGRRIPAKTIAEIRARIEELKPRIDEFRLKVDEIKLRNDNLYSSGMHEIRILRSYGTPESLRWQED